MTLSGESPLPDPRPERPGEPERPDINNDASSASPTTDSVRNDRSTSVTKRPDTSEPCPLLDAEATIETRPFADTTSSDHTFHAHNMSQSSTFQQSDLRSPSPIPQESEPHLPVTRPKRSLRQRIRVAWLASKGMILVIFSQFFGATMNVMAQILEKDGAHGKGMHPFQILFARMFITVIASYLYMWYAKVSEPFGTPEVRWLLVARAVGGFFGVFGMYYSLLYMPLAEATVITFLAPIVACYACSFFMPDEKFTRKQQLAAVVSLLGVVLIARPFTSSKQSGPEPGIEEIPESTGNCTTIFAEIPEESTDSGSAYRRLIGVAFALLGVFGAACAYTTIRAIGKRAHALVSVTYFSVYTTLVSVVAMLTIPSVSFRLPGNWMEWGLLLGLGASGFALQYLMTAGLAYRPPTGQQGSGTRATSMVYTQMLFALLYDRLIMHSSLSALSWAGSCLILGSAIYVAVVREGRKGTRAEEGHSDDGRTTAPARKDVLDESQNPEEEQGLLAEEESIDVERGDNAGSSSR